MRLRTAFVLIILCAVAVRAFPSDLLQQEGSLRVVTGDWAVWATRGVEVTPEACSAPLPLLKAMLTQCGLSEKETAFADALAKGLNTRGWAQLEAEPEGGNLKLRVWATSGTPRTLVMERLDIEQGVTARATARLPDGPVEIQQPPRTEILDRSVYRSLLSPESFVLNQEHFQKQFFESMLDLGTPGMETVRAAYEGRKPGLALYELAEFFRRKTAPAALIRKPAESPTAKEDLAAEEVCRHLFKKGDQTVDLGPVINWTRNKTDDAEWLWSLNKHTQFLMLVEGYLKTGNEEYVDEFCAQICDWIIQNPAPPYVLTRVGAWRNLEAGGRCSTAWPPAFYGFLSSPRLTPHAIQLILASLWSHGDYLLKHPAGLRKPNNWSIIDSTGLTAVGVYFPELAGAAAWRDTGYERLSRQLAMQVYPDGFQYELAPGYHVFCLKNFDKAFMLARETGVTLPPDFAKRLETMYEALMWIAKPDRRAPMASDSSVLPLKDLLLEGAARFARDDFRWVATEGAEGRPPDGTSHALPYAGYFVMREDWSSAAQYLFFDGGPLGVSHSHEEV